MFTANRMQAAPVVISKEHLELAEPQAVVINSGVGERRHRPSWRARCARDRGRGGAAARPRRRGGPGALDRRDRETRSLSTRFCLRCERPPTLLSESGGGDAAEAILTTDTHAKQAVAHGPGFTVGGMAKGSGMIHPNLATMLAVVTTDYPLEPGEAIELPAPRGRRELQRDLRRRRVFDERHRRSARERRERRSTRTAANDARSHEALRAVCADLAGQIVTDGEGATFSAAIAVSGAASDPEAKAIARRIATSPLVKTALFGRDANWGRVLAAAARRRTTAATRNSTPTASRSTQRHVRVVDAGAPQDVEPTLDGAGCTIVLDLGARRGERQLPDERPLLRLRPHQRGVPLVSLVVLKCGGAVAERIGRRDPAARRRGSRRVRRARRRAADLRGDGAVRHSRRVRRRPARHRRRQGLAVVRASFAAVNRALCAALGPRAVGSSATRSGSMRRRSPSSGYVGDPLPSRPRAVVEALASGHIPVVAPLGVGPLNVNADEAAAALAVGLGADRLLFVTDVAGRASTTARCVDAIGAGEADRLLGDGTFEGGIVPKLRAAVIAARDGVQHRDRRDGGGRVSASPQSASYPTYAREDVTFVARRGDVALGRRRAALPRPLAGIAVVGLGHCHPAPLAAAAGAARPALARLEPLLDRADGRARAAALRARSAARTPSSATRAPRRSRRG